MKRENITIPYKIILKKLWKESYFGEIGIKKYREILFRFRMGKCNWKDIFKEMKSLNYIDYKGTRIGLLQIKVPLKDLV